jgi:hypothetical protein
MNNRPSPSASRNSFRIFTDRYVSTRQIPAPLKRACLPIADSGPAGKLRRRWARNPFSINTYKSVSKQRTSTPFGINTYKKTGGGGRGVLLLTCHPVGMPVLPAPDGSAGSDLRMATVDSTPCGIVGSAPGGRDLSSYPIRTPVLPAPDGSGGATGTFSLNPSYHPPEPHGGGLAP